MNRILLLLSISLYPFLSKAQLPAEAGLGMDQRYVKDWPNVVNSYDQTGKIVVEVHVDRKGNVISAIVGARGTTIGDSVLLHKCQKAALNAKFNSVTNAPELQICYLTFVFKIQSKTDSKLVGKKDS